MLLVLTAGCGSASHRDSVRAAGSQPPPTTPAWVKKPGLQPCPAATPTGRAQLPAVTLRCLGSGPDLSLARLPARPYVINLWASWCVPCQREAPRLAAAAAAANGQVDFLGIDTADDRDSALDFLHHFGISYPQLADPNSDTLHRLPAPGIPVTVAIDATGRIVYRRIGEISAAQLTAALHAADPGVGTGAGEGR